MFDFRNGMLGVVIIALAIAGALFGGYLAGIDTEEVEVTKYDYLADVTGLFDYDESPQYIQFDPSTNYTGYYSETSYDGLTEKYYFASDEVDYDKSNQTNNYKINIKPTHTATGGGVFRTTVYDTDVQQPFDDNTNVYFTNTYGEYKNRHCDSIMLKDWIEKNQFTNDGTNLLYFMSQAAYQEFAAANDYNANWLLFSTKDMWDDPHEFIDGNLPINTKVMMVASQQYMDDNRLQPGYTTHGVKTYLPYFSCIVDTKNKTATLCYDSFCQEPGLTGVALDKLVVSFGGTNLSGSLILDDVYSLEGYEIYYEYLDPNKGVWLKEREE